ncbi:MAG: hypothetical protein ACOYN0_01090 [Phycisphaerales bacterium]
MTTFACPPDFGAPLAETAQHIGPVGPVLAVFTGGLVLLLAGGRMIKPLTVLGGLLLGAAIGVKVLAPELAQRGMHGPPELLGVLAGGAGGVMLALATFRLLTAAAGGLTLGGVALLGSLAYLGVSGAALPARSEAASVISSAPLDTDEALAYRAAADEAFRTLLETRDAKAAGQTLASVNPEPARRTVDHVQARAQELWEGLSEQSRALIGATSALGVMMGVMLGLFGPRSATAAVTSFAGAAVAISSGLSLANSFGWTQRDVGSFSPAALMATWLAVAGAGLWLQSTGARRREERARAVQEARKVAAAARCGARCGGPKPDNAGGTPKNI